MKEAMRKGKEAKDMLQPQEDLVDHQKMLLDQFGQQTAPDTSGESNYIFFYYFHCHNNFSTTMKLR